MLDVDFIASGGSAKGVPVVFGALKCLLEHDINPIRVACTSSGSTVIGLWATGLYTLSQLEYIVLDTDYSKFLTTGLLSKIKLVYKILRGSPSHNIALSDGEEYLACLRKLTQDKTFSDIKIDLWLTGTNINRHELVLFSKDTYPNMLIADAIRISSSLPFGFADYYYDGSYWTDGGVYQHLPLGTLKSRSRPRIAVLISDKLHVNSNIDYDKTHGINGKIQLLLDLMIEGNIREAIGDAPKDLILVRATAGDYDSFKFNFTKQEKVSLIKEGYNSTLNSLKQAGII